MEIERKWMVNGWPEGENLPALPLKEEFAMRQEMCIRDRVNTVSSRLWARTPAIKLPAMLSGAMSPSNRLRPSMQSEMCIRDRISVVQLDVLAHQRNGAGLAAGGNAGDHTLPLGQVGGGHVQFELFHHHIIQALSLIHI